MLIDTGADANDAVLLDTSTAIALVVEDHEAHSQTLNALRGRRLGLAGHAWFEAFSVLTRLPPGLRLSPADALRVLTANFPASAFLGETEASALAREIAPLGISGGAVYDALVGAAARQHGRRLASRDRRALAIYEALGVETEAIA
ncbi:MAG TPA: type II toxin-antitoxin system VapC family toxin [Dehalococcoidia bacterium]|nr:type II toxin-antitoxin system VapC family toxin [Dehalococcoidia bacterium]